MSALPSLSSTALIGSAGSTTNDTSRLDTAANLKAAGEKFEAIFIGMMLKSMRKASLGSDLLGSATLDKFRDMQDDKTAQSMAAKMPLGIGTALTKFLSQSQSETGAALTASQPSSATDAKGSAEGGS